MDHKTGSGQRYTKIVICLLILVTLICAGVTIYLLNKSGPETVPAYAPQKIDDNARKVEDEGDREKLEAQEGGGAVSITYSAEVSVDLSEDIVHLLVENPERSTQDMIIQVLLPGQDDDEIEIARSELIPAGYGVSQIKLQESAGIATGGCAGKIRLSYYDPDGGEKAVVNTDIPVTVTVTE